MPFAAAVRQRIKRMLKAKRLLLAGCLAISACCPKPVPVVPPTGTSGTPDKPFNVVWKHGDLNGLPMNPGWGTQIPASSNLPPPATPPECVRDPNLKPSCTDQDTFIDEAVFPNLAICSLIPASHIHGHANWMPVEYVGGIAWWNLADDWDYNFAVIPNDFAGLTNFNNTIEPSGKPLKFIEAEFDSQETVDRFVTRWWTQFRETAARLDNDATQALLAGDKTRIPQAVIVGLFGLDCEHDCRSEIHPVYGMAVETSDRADDNVWVMFVRNWGNEGFCSHYDHQVQFADNKITLMLPRASKGTPTVNVQNTEFAASDGFGIPFPVIEHVTGEGTKITFQLPAPEKHALAEMVLHMKWTHDTYSPPKWKRKIKDFGRFTKAMKPNANQREAGKEDKAEDYLHDLFPLAARVRPQPGQRTLAPPEAQRNIPAPATQTAPLKQLALKSLSPPPKAPALTPRPDERKTIRDCEFIRAICSKYNNAPPVDRIPDFPKLCSELSQPNACSEAASRSRK